MKKYNHMKPYKPKDGYTPGIFGDKSDIGKRLKYDGPVKKLPEHKPKGRALALSKKLLQSK